MAVLKPHVDFRLSARFFLALSVIILIEDPHFAAGAAPAVNSVAVHKLTLKLNDPALTANEKSELYLRRARTYLSLIEPKSIRLCSPAEGIGENRHAAVEDFVAAVQSNPRNAEAFIELGDQSYCDAIARNDNTDNALFASDIKQSVADYATALRLGLPSDKERSLVYYKRAIVEVSDEEILTDLNAAIHTDGHNGDIFYARGFYFYRLSNYVSETMLNKAVADFSTALSLPLSDEGPCAVYIQRARAYERLRKYDLALADYSSVFKAYAKFVPENACWASYDDTRFGLNDDLKLLLNDLYQTRASMYDKVGRPQAAEADRKMMDVGPIAPPDFGGAYDNPPHGAY